MIDFRDKMLAVIQGDTPNGALFVPRLDIWYNRNKTQGTLPVGYENLSLREIVAKIGVAFHSVVPDFIRSAPEEDIYHRALGFYNNPDFPYRADFNAVDFDVEKTEMELKVIYHASSGDITTSCRFGRDVFDSGVSIPDITEHAVKKENDYIRLAEILSKVKILPMPDNYNSYRDRIGNDGLAVAFLSLASGPMQHIMRDLRKYEDFCLDQFDCPDKIAILSEHLAVLYEKIIDSVLETNAEVALFGANYDDTITYPPFFEEHITPWLNKAADKLHFVGKYLLTHTDGENEKLLPSFANCRFDIADSICPSPMTKVTIQHYREFFDGRVTIWGGIPSVMMLRDLCSDRDFKDYIQTLLKDSKPYNNLILSIADTTPPDTDLDRIKYISEECFKTFA